VARLAVLTVLEVLAVPKMGFFCVLAFSSFYYKVLFNTGCPKRSTRVEKFYLTSNEKLKLLGEQAKFSFNEFLFILGILFLLLNLSYYLT
jgi:hypothetical protein